MYVISHNHLHYCLLSLYPAAVAEYTALIPIMKALAIAPVDCVSMAQTPRCVSPGSRIVRAGQAPVSTPFGTRILPGLMKSGVLTEDCLALMN